MTPSGFGRPPVWSRVWPYLLAIPAGLVFGLAIAVVIARWL